MFVLGSTGHSKKTCVVMQSAEWIRAKRVSLKKRHAFVSTKMGGPVPQVAFNEQPVLSQQETSQHGPPLLWIITTFGLHKDS